MHIKLKCLPSIIYLYTGFAVEELVSKLLYTNITCVVYKKFPELFLGDSICRFEVSPSNQQFNQHHPLSQRGSETGDLNIAHLENSRLENWVYCFTYKLFSLCFIIKFDLFPEEIYRHEVNNMCSQLL